MSLSFSNHFNKNYEKKKNYINFVPPSNLCISLSTIITTFFLVITLKLGSMTLIDLTPFQFHFHTSFLFDISFVKSMKHTGPNIININI